MKPPANPLSGRLRRGIPPLALAWFGLLPSTDVALPQSLEHFTTIGLSIEERMQLRCPPAEMPGSFAEPAAVAPVPEMVLETSYSEHDDFVRLVGEDAPRSAHLGAGDDTVLLYRTVPEMMIDAGSGADTILVCSMEDLVLYLGVSLSPETDPNVVIVEPAVFAGVPESMDRHIQLSGFEIRTDRLVIHAPSKFLDRTELGDRPGQFTIGRVTFAHVPLADQQSFDPRGEAVILVLDGE